MKRQIIQVVASVCSLGFFAGLAAAQAKPAKPITVPGEMKGVQLVSPVPDGKWALPAGDYANTRYSPLNRINTSNVKKLKVVDIVSDGITRGHEGQPLVVNNTLYMVTPFPNNLLAFDLTKPNFPLKWEYKPGPNGEAFALASRGWVNRGASYADGKIIYATLDDNVIAVNAKTGKQVWRTKVGSLSKGETTTMAPLIVKNVVLVGNSGGNFGVRGKLTALDLSNGDVKWTAYNTGPDKDVRIDSSFHPYYSNAKGKNLGVSSWPADAWKRGGGTVWGWISYDPELNLIYYGTGNAAPLNPDQRSGDNKWTCTIWARNPETGQAKWADQLVPHDAWGYSAINENILVDMDWQGKMRKLLLHPGANGFMFVIDRTDGQILSAKTFEPVNWADGYNLKTGLPEVNPTEVTHMGAYARNVCPSSAGAKGSVPSAFSPQTGLLYIPAHNTCMNYEAIKANYIARTPFLGANTLMFPGPGGYQGELVAWDVKDGKKVWSIKDQNLPVYSGVLATGGGLVFYGTMEGWFRAVDARTGKILWQFKTGSGIVGDPMTFTGPHGKQYIAIYSGVGGRMGMVAQPDISASDPYAALGAAGAMKDLKKVTAPGDQLYIFALP